MAGSIDGGCGLATAALSEQWSLMERPSGRGTGASAIFERRHSNYSWDERDLGVVRMGCEFTRRWVGGVGERTYNIPVLDLICPHPLVQCERNGRGRRVPVVGDVGDDILRGDAQPVRRRIYDALVRLPRGDAPHVPDSQSRAHVCRRASPTRVRSQL